MILPRQIAEWKDKYERDAGELPEYLVIHIDDLPALSAAISKVTGTKRDIALGDMILGMRICTMPDIAPGMMYLLGKNAVEQPEGVRTE